MRTPDPGLVMRPLVRDDVEAVHSVLVAAEEADLGFASIDVNDIVGDWQRPSFDLVTDSLGVFDGDRLLGCIEVYRGTRAVGAVHPAHRGRGIGSALVAWSEQHALGKGAVVLGNAVPERSGGPELLSRRGYDARWTAWILELGAGDDILGDRSRPDGLEIRPMRAGEQAATHRVVEDAFGEWEGREEGTFDDWAATTLLRPGFEPWHMLVAVQEGDVVGVCNLGVEGGTAWVAELAVRRDQRGRGLGRLLLIDAFDRGRAAGATRFELATDSRTGALGLYERVGMRIAATFVHFRLDLTSRAG